MDGCTAASKALSQKAILGIGLGLCVLPSLPCMGNVKALSKATVLFNNACYFLIQ